MQRRLGIALLALTWLTALIVTLYPFEFSLEVASLSRVDWRIYYPGHNDRDLVLNLLMLAPLGVGLALVRVASIKRLALEAAAIGFGTALVIESAQVFERARFPQLADVWRNGIGCVVGAIAAAVIIRARARSRDSRASR